MNVQYTNHHNIPAPIAEAIMEIDGDYTKGASDFSTTELTAPPRIRALKQRLIASGAPLVRDVGDLVYSVMGSAVHYVLERLAKKDRDYISEKRYYRNFGPHVIGGQIDLYHPKSETMWDWKSTKSTTYRDGVKAEYIQQLNINAWIMNGNGLFPKNLRSGVIYRDYSKVTAGVKGPAVEAEEFPVELWPRFATEGLIENRIKLHLEAEKELPECTEHERWASPAVWAVQSRISGRAIPHGLCSTQEDAEAKLKAHKKPSTLGVVHRPGRSLRCAKYCSMASICGQWANDETNPINQ